MNSIQFSSKHRPRMKESIRNVRSYKKTPVIEVPEIPQYFKLLLPSTLSSSLLLSPTELQESPSTMSLSPLGSPFDVLIDGSSSQPRLRQSRQADEQSSHTSLSEWKCFLKALGSILLAKFWKSCSTFRVASLESPILKVLFTRRPSLDFSKDGTRSRCLISLSSSMGINTVHPHHLRHFIPSVMPHFLLLSLLLKYFMLVLPYSHGQPTSSLDMSIRRLTSFLIQIFLVAKIIFELQLMAAAQITLN